MGPFQHLLVPIDFGEAMQPAIDMAVALGRKLDARITLLNSFDVAPFAMSTPFAPPIDIEPLITAANDELSRVLARVREEFPNSDAIFRRGAPYDAILEAAKAEGIDLIVIGTHGRKGVARMLLGSVTERVVRLSEIPVLTVHPPRLRPEPPRSQRGSPA